MVTVRQWTGRSARLLRKDALRLSVLMVRVVSIVSYCPVRAIQPRFYGLRDL